MEKCPKCKRHSLEYNATEKAARCLFMQDCGFVKKGLTAEKYASLFAPEEKKIGEKLSKRLAWV